MKAFLNPLGTHVLAELRKCNPSKLADVALMERVMIEAAIKTGATILENGVVKHDFDPGGPGGVTILIGIAESHVSIHTWPEYGYAMADALTCGSHTDPAAAIIHLIEELESKDPSVNEMKRGILSIGGENMPHKPEGA